MPKHIIYTDKHGRTSTITKKANKPCDCDGHEHEHECEDCKQKRLQKNSRSTAAKTDTGQKTVTGQKTAKTPCLSCEERRKQNNAKKSKLVV